MLLNSSITVVRHAITFRLHLIFNTVEGPLDIESFYILLNTVTRDMRFIVYFIIVKTEHVRFLEV